jgi:hypothetical protein
MSAVKGNRALNAVAVALSSSAATKVFEPILISFDCFPQEVWVSARMRGEQARAQQSPRG